MRNIDGISINDRILIVKNLVALSDTMAKVSQNPDTEKSSNVLRINIHALANSVVQNISESLFKDQSPVSNEFFQRTVG